MKQHSFIRTTTLVAATAVAIAIGASARTSAQTAATKPASGGAKASSPSPATGYERLEGDWIRIDPDGSGTFDTLTSKFTQASLTPEAKTAAQAARRRQDA